MTALVEVTGPTTAPLTRTSWRRFLRSPMGFIGGFMLLTAIVTAIAAPLLAPYDPYAPTRVTIFDKAQSLPQNSSSRVLEKRCKTFFNTDFLRPRSPPLQRLY